MAAEVIERFRNDQTIRLNQISRDKLLNEYLNNYYRRVYRVRYDIILSAS